LNYQLNITIMKKSSYLSSLAIFIASIVFTNTGFTQGGRTNPGDKFGKYQFEQKFKTSGGTVYQLSYGCGDISDAIDGIKKDYDKCDVKVDTIADAHRFPITKFQKSFSVPSLGNAGVAAQKGGQDSLAFEQMLKKIVDSGQVYMKELKRDTCDNKKDLKKLVYEIRCYKPDKGTLASTRWRVLNQLFKQGRITDDPGPAPASLPKDSMSVTNIKITITCVCPVEPSEYEEEETFDPSFKSAGNAGSLSEELIIYPNPASSVINFSYPPANASDENLEIEVKLDVFNAYGQLIDRLNIHRFSYDANSLQLDVSTHSAGLYIYSLSVGQQTYRGQFVKD
jgi:hypothetical protein